MNKRKRSQKCINDCNIDPVICCLMNTNVQIFISYSRGALMNNLSDLLFKHLQLHGYSGFLDRYSIIPSIHWRDQLSMALTACHAGVVILDEKYSKSTNEFGCIYEFATMRQRGIPIIPIVVNDFVIEKDTPLDEVIRVEGEMPQYIRWNVNENDADVINTVIRALCALGVSPTCPKGKSFSSPH